LTKHNRGHARAR